MGYTVNPPAIDEVTGQVVGEPEVFNRNLSRQQLTVEDVDPNEHNDAIAPHYARKAAEASLPIFSEDATDADVLGFWKSDKQLTESEVDAIQAAYVATDNADLANLLMWKLTGDPSHLSEQQLYELSLEEATEAEDTTSEMSAEEATDYIYNNAAEPNQETADAILQLDLGDTDAASVVQYLSYKYFAGEVSLDDAYNEALNSGIDPDQLTTVFNQLRKHFA